MNLPALNSRYMRAEETAEIVNGNPVVNILNRRTGNELAKVFFYLAWKRWCWTQAAQGVVFSDDCSDAIGEFCRQMNGLPKKVMPT